MLCFRCGSYNVEDATQCSVCGQAFLDEKGREVAGVQRRPSGAKLTAAIFAPGETVCGRYKIVDILGQGGVGVVYRARDLELDVDVALKAIAPNLLQTEEEQRLFSRQMKAARKLHHANIIRIYDEGHEGQRRFYTMKLLEGLTLRKIIRLRHDKGQAFTPEEIIPIFHQLAAALDYAHKTTWHGDLKPENIIILPDVLKVTDFNLVKGLPLKPFLGIAKSRSKGFPYIAPELRVEASQIDGRCDIYSLGVILGEMLTGLVFEGHFTRALTAALEQLPPKVDGLVRRAVAEHPDGRFAKASELAKELEASLSKLAPDGLPAPARPAGASTSSPLATPVHKPSASPPPPPLETSPGAAPVDTKDERGPASEEGLEEIGQSQVLLLDESPHPVISDEDGPNTSSDKESPTLHAQQAALRAEGIIETLFSSEDEASLVPPPLPDDGALDASDSFEMPRRPPLSPRDAGDDDQETLADELPGAIAEDDEEEETQPDLEDVGIHEELTALKPHPRPDLVEPLSDEEDAEPAPPPAPPIDDDDDDESMAETLTAAQLEAAKERSSPRLRSAQALSPPVVSPQEPAYVPPTLRPVAPPARKKSAAGLYIGVAAVAVVAVGVALAFSKGLIGGGGSGGSSGGGGGPVAVVVDAGSSSAPGETSPPVVDDPPAATVDAGAKLASDPSTPDPAAPVGVEPTRTDPTPALSDDDRPPRGDRDEDRARRERERREADRLAAEARAREEMEAREEAERQRREEDKRLAALARDDEAKRRADEEREEKRRKAEEERKRAEEEKRRKAEEEKAAKVAAVPTKCPRGMKLIPAGSLTFGSSPSDPMRNFGENLATKIDVPAYCIDYYEYPNSKSHNPTTGVTWNQAKSTCERKGKRLCSEAEWERACKGPSNLRFSYGNSWDPGRCNTEDEQGNPRPVAGAVAFPKCRSAFNVFALSGNVEEWTADSFRPGAPSKTVKGGAADRPDWASRCAARRGVSSKTSKPTLGFRCCADAQ